MKIILKPCETLRRGNRDDIMCIGKIIKNFIQYYVFVPIHLTPSPKTIKQLNEYKKFKRRILLKSFTCGIKRSLK